MWGRQATLLERINDENGEGGGGVVGMGGQLLLASVERTSESFFTPSTASFQRGRLAATGYSRTWKFAHSKTQEKKI